MPVEPTHISLETLLAAAPLLGHDLEDRRTVRDGQEPELVEHLLGHGSRRLASSAQRGQFVVAPLDLLLARDSVSGEFRLHLLELNGTGIGGITNLPDRCLRPILASLEEVVGMVDDPTGVVAVAISGRESVRAPRANRLLHEKLLFVDAVKTALERRHGAADVRSIDRLSAERSAPRAARPTVVFGYIKDLLRAASVDAGGCVRLGGRRLAAAVNDRFCGNLVQRFAGRIDVDGFLPINRCFAAGSDKGVAYRMVNSLAAVDPHPLAPQPMLHAHAFSRDELIDLVCEWLLLGRRPVIKPHGTGLGHGIEFFLDPNESRAAVAARVDGSLRQTGEFYDMPGGALPYTVCEFVDALRVADPAHALAGHRFELRVVVYRDGGTLRAIPSVAKVAREPAGDGPRSRRSLINNVTASGDTCKVLGTDYVLPLCNRSTLTALGLTVADLERVAGYASRLVAHTLHRWGMAPSDFELAPAEAVLASGPMLRASA